MMPLTWQECAEGMIAHFSKDDAVFGMETNEDAVFDTYCVYRGNQDPTSQVRCAAGCLIPDDLYDPEMENIVFGDQITKKFSGIGDLFDKKALDFVGRAQSVHDGFASDGRKGKSISDFVAAVKFALANDSSFRDEV